MVTHHRSDRGIRPNGRCLSIVVFFLLATATMSSNAGAQAFVPVELVLDETGVPGLPPVLTFPFGVAASPAGDVYVSGLGSDNVLKARADGTISEVIDVSGAGLGAPLADPSELTVDAAGNVYVIGEASDNAFRITPDGAITEIIDALGDGAGSALDFPTDIEVDSAGNAFVSSRANSNVFRISPTNVVTLVVDAAGAGAGAPLIFPDALAVDDQDNLYIAGHSSENVLQRRPDGSISEIIGPDGDGLGHPMHSTDALAVGPSGDVFVAAYDQVGGAYSVWVWRATTGVVEKLPIASFFISHLAIGSGGEIFTTSSEGVDEYWPDGTYRRKRFRPNPTTSGFPLLGPWGLGIDSTDALFVAGRFSDSVLRLTPLPEPGIAISLAMGFAAIALRRPRRRLPSALRR